MFFYLKVDNYIIFPLGLGGLGGLGGWPGAHSQKPASAAVATAADLAGAIAAAKEATAAAHLAQQRVAAAREQVLVCFPIVWVDTSFYQFTTVNRNDAWLLILLLEMRFN